MRRLAVLRRFGVVSPVRRAALGTTGGALFNQGMLIVSGSLSARLLGPTDRGHLALLVLVPSVLGIAGSFGLAYAVTYFVAQAPPATTRVLSSIQRELILQLIVVTGLHVVITLAWLIPNLDESQRSAAFVALGAVPASFVTQYGMAILQGHQRFLAFTVIFVTPQFLYSLGVAVLYVSRSGGLVSIVLTYTVASLVTGSAAVLLASAYVRRTPRARVSPSRDEIRAFARKSYFGQVAPIESFRLDQLIVGAALTPTVLGYYTAATAFTNLSRFLGTSMGYVLSPHIAALPKDRQRRSLLRGLLLTAAICGLVTFALIPATDFLIPLLFGEAFRPAIPLAKVLLIAGFLLGVRRAVLAGLQGIGHPEIGSYSELLALIVFATLLPVALTSSSGMGIAVVFLTSAVVAMAFIVILFQRRVDKPAPTGAKDRVRGDS